MGLVQKLKKSEAGFTLMEILLAMALFSILSLTVGSLLSNTINTSKRLTEKSMKLEDARIAMDFIQTHIKAADEVTINSPTQITLKNGTETRNFKFNANTIEFSGNVLAQDVKTFNISKTEDIIKIKIAMEDGKGYKGIELVGEIHTKYKIVLPTT